MNSSYMSSSIFNEKNSYCNLEDTTRIKNMRLSNVFKNVYGKDFSSSINNLISARDNLRKENSNINYIPSFEDNKEISNINADAFNSNRKETKTLPDLHANFIKKNSNFEHSPNFTRLNNLENSDFIKDDNKTINNLNLLTNNNLYSNLNVNLINSNSINMNNNNNINNNNTTYSFIKNSNNYNKNTTANVNNSINFKNSKNLNINNNSNFCPICSHCNNISDPNFEHNLSVIREAKNILTSSFEFIVKNDLIDTNRMTIFSNSNNDGEDEKKELKKVVQDFENLLINNSKSMSHRNNRLVYKVIAYFLDKLITDKICLDNLIPNASVIDKFENMLILQGLAFEEHEEKLLFDDELEDLFDVNTREKIKNLIRSKEDLHLLKNFSLNVEFFKS